MDEHLHYLVFREAHDQQQLLDWHSSLYKRRAVRAELRRAESPADALLSQGLRDLASSLSQKWSEPHNLLALAALAAVLAHVETHKGGHSFAAQLAAPKKETGCAAMSELRFAQLQKSRDLDELFLRLIRAVRLLGGAVNILSLADDLFHWQREQRGEWFRDPRKHLKVRWGMDYYTQLAKTEAVNRS